MKHAANRLLLIVDDNPLIAAMYKSVFESRGAVVLFGNTAEVALGIAREQQPDLVVTDLVMPGVGGFDLLKDLKSLPETKDIPVLVLTAANDETWAAEARKAGAVDYILKYELPLQSIADRVLSHLGADRPLR